VSEIEKFYAEFKELENVDNFDAEPKSYNPRKDVLIAVTFGSLFVLLTSSALYPVIPLSSFGVVTIFFMAIVSCATMISKILHIKATKKQIRITLNKNIHLWIEQCLKGDTGIKYVDPVKVKQAAKPKDKVVNLTSENTFNLGDITGKICNIGYIMGGGVLVQYTLLRNAEECYHEILIKDTEFHFLQNELGHNIPEKLILLYYIVREENLEEYLKCLDK